MKLRTLYPITHISVFLLAGFPVHASGMDMEGSDTLYCIVETLMRPMGERPEDLDPERRRNLEALAQAIGIVTNDQGCGDVEYFGTGSDSGEQAACRGSQDLVPMSRVFSAWVCDSDGCPSSDAGTTPSGVAIAGDAITLVRNSGTSDKNRCVNLRGEAMTTLRILYSGDGTGSPTSCDSQERRDLVSRFSALFEDCDQTSDCELGMTNAYRRGDTSGTTSVFKDLVGISGFCNGDEVSDEDPIRRPCSASDRVCGADGTLGIVLPVFIDETTQFTMEEVNNDIPCGISKFGYARPPFLTRTNCPYGPEGNTIGGVCAYPVDNQGRYGCKARGGFTSRPGLASADPNFDPRVYNLTPRSFSGQIIPVSNSGAAFYRAAQDPDKEAGCFHGNPSSTKQIGCLTRHVDCSVGWAGRSNDAVFSQNLETKVASSRLNATAINDSAYPLVRKMYLNSISGFSRSSLGGASSPQNRFLNCVQSEQEHESLGGRTILQEAVRLNHYTPLPLHTVFETISACSWSDPVSTKSSPDFRVSSAQ